MRRLAAFLSTMLQVPGTDQTWISPGEVARKVSQERRCSEREVTAALLGDVIPASDVVEAVVGLRAERQGGSDSSRIRQILHDEAERLRSAALLSRPSLHDASPFIDQSTPKRFRKKLGWAVGVAGATIISLFVTNVIPGVLDQFASPAKVGDAIRPGPDIIISESIYNPDGSDAPAPIVIPGNYKPSSQIVRDLSNPSTAWSAAVQRQFRNAGAINIQNLFIRIILQGNRNEPVRILGIQPINLRRTDPLDGVLFDMFGGQGEISNIQMDFNLDKLSPHALTVISNDDITSRPFFKAHTISLTNGEQAVLVIQASTYCYSASFDLAVNYVVGSTTRTDVISHNGHPFRVSAYRFAKNGQLAFKQDFEYRSNYSVVPIKPKPRSLPVDLIRTCPYFPANEGS